jgi:hypothetical protein
MKALYILVAVVGIHLPTFAVAQVPLEALRSCLEVEDQSKERLDCYDEKIAPAPRALLHLSYSCIPPCGPAILVTQDPKRTCGSGRETRQPELHGRII